MTETTTNVKPSEVKQPLLPLTDATDDSDSFTPSGMWLVMRAMLENINAVQNYDASGLVGLSNSVNMLNEGYTDQWFASLKGDLSKLNADLAAGGDDMGAKVNVDMTTFNLHNTQYNQSSTFYSGIVSGVNQSSETDAQNVSLDIQLYQQGPLATIQTIAQVV